MNNLEGGRCEIITRRTPLELLHAMADDPTNERFLPSIYRMMDELTMPQALAENNIFEPHDIARVNMPIEPRFARQFEMMLEAEGTPHYDQEVMRYTARRYVVGPFRILECFSTKPTRWETAHHDYRLTNNHESLLG